MRRLFIILSFLILASCQKGFVPKRYEDKLIVTKKYVGRVTGTIYQDKYTMVFTDSLIFYICGNHDIPDSVHAYIKTLPVYVDVHPSIAKQLESKQLICNNQKYRVKTW